MRFRLDTSVRRFGTTIVGGSPLRVFRLTERGSQLLDRIGAGEEVGTSRLVDALLDAGAIHPRSAATTGRFGVDDVTIVVPALGIPLHVAPGALVVDDGSRPPLVGATVRLPHNRGPAAARNAGLGLVGTPLVAFVDADVALPEGWLAPLLHHFDDDRVALVAPRVRSRRSPGVLGRYEREHGPLDLGPEPARIRAGSRVSYVPAATIVCRVDALRSVGGFDESMRVGEDVDLVWRLDAAGWRCRYDPCVEVEHEPRPDWCGWVRQRITYGSSAAPLSRRHPGALAPFRASGWSVAAWAAAALGQPIVAGGIALGTGAALARKLPDVPRRVALQLAIAGTWRAGEQLAAAVRRAWWPLLGLFAVRSRRARGLLATSLLVAGSPIRLADDLAYSIGVWWGVASRRTVAPLVPELAAWPGRVQRPATPSAPASEPLPSAR